MKDDPFRYKRLRAIFDEALQKDLADRQSYLDAVCIADSALQSELQRLLDAHERATSFLERTVALSERSYTGDDFCGTARFKILHRLGAGGMGVVYEVRDLVRDEVVALKTLRHITPVGVYRLKQEFRSLAGVAHPNLVCLYELVVEDACCFFTMERVPGVSFVDHVREHTGASLSLNRLTPALRQLVDGMSALHRSGRLHRDIKPSNVLVTAEGRVVILDFGLIAELYPGSLGGVEQVIGGTPAYVAPEAGFGGAPSEAGDWYSVGATLYEALTGQLPFRGSLAEVLLRKREVDPPSPAELAPDVPAELSSICLEMMCRDPVTPAVWH
jgi:serine/threonine protein kinase